MPPSAASPGTTRLRRSVSSPIDSSRRTSRPITKKNSDHQAVVDPVAEVLGDLRVADPDGEHGVPQRDVGVRQRRVRPQQREQRRAEQQAGAPRLVGEERADRLRELGDEDAPSRLRLRRGGRGEDGRHAPESTRRLAARERPVVRGAQVVEHALEHPQRLADRQLGLDGRAGLRAGGVGSMGGVGSGDGDGGSIGGAGLGSGRGTGGAGSGAGAGGAGGVISAVRRRNSRARKPRRGGSIATGSGSGSDSGSGSGSSTATGSGSGSGCGTDHASSSGATQRRGFHPRRLGLHRGQRHARAPARRVEGRPCRLRVRPPRRRCSPARGW